MAVVSDIQRWITPLFAPFLTLQMYTAVGYLRQVYHPQWISNAQNNAYELMVQGLSQNIGITKHVWNILDGYTKYGMILIIPPRLQRRESIPN